MVDVDNLSEAYTSLEHRYEIQSEEAIDASCLLAFD